jgi:cytochrome c
VPDLPRRRAGREQGRPVAHGIIGRQAGTIPGFRYSPANKNSGITWTEDVMFAYLEDPRKYIPGTYMSFVGLKQPQQRADVIAYLKTQS